MAKAASIHVDLVANTARYRSEIMGAARTTTRELGLIRKEVAANARSFDLMKRAAVGVISLRALQSAAGSLLNVTKQQQALVNSMRAATGTAEDAASALDFVSQKAKELGLDYQSAAEGFQRLTASATANGIAMRDQQQLFLEVARASTAMQIAPAQVDRAMTALSQSFSKGRFMAEELRQQLAEAIPGVVPRFQKAVLEMTKGTDLAGKSFDQLLQGGLLDVQTFLPAMTQAFAQMGVTWREGASALQAETNRLGNAWREAKLQFASGPFGDVAIAGIRATAGALNNVAETLPAIMQGTGAVAGAISGLAGVKLAEATAGWVRGLGAAQASMLAEAVAAEQAAAALVAKTRAEMVDAQATAARARAAYGGSIAADLAAMQATQAHTRALGAHSAAQATATAASSRLAAVGRSVLGIFGGPIGLVATVGLAAAGWLIFRDNTSAATEAAEAHKRALDQLNETARVDARTAIQLANRMRMEAGGRLQVARATLAQLQAELQLQQAKKQPAGPNSANAQAFQTWGASLRFQQQKALVDELKSQIDDIDLKIRSIGGVQAAVDFLDAGKKIAAADTSVTDTVSSNAKARQKAYKDEQQALRDLAAEELRRLDNQLNADIQNTGRSNLIDLFSIGHGGDAVEMLRRQLEIHRQHQDELQRLRDSGIAKTDASYIAQEERLKRHLEEKLKLERDYQEARKALEKDWRVGLNRAVEDYIADAKNMAAQTNTLFTNAFREMEDAFVKFVQTGKLSFTDLANSIIADLARIAARKMISGVLEGLLGSLGQGGGGGSYNWAKSVGFGNNFQWATGGYTGPGGKYQPAGVVHKGEVVWSQQDVARAGGVAAVEAMRRGMKGYADGGVVGPVVPVSTAGGISKVVIENRGAPIRAVDSRMERQSDGTQVLRVVLDAVAEDIATGGHAATAIKQRFGLREMV